MIGRSVINHNRSGIGHDGSMFRRCGSGSGLRYDRPSAGMREKVGKRLRNGIEDFYLFFGGRQFCF